jgi:hypothetical protein
MPDAPQADVHRSLGGRVTLAIGIVAALGFCLTMAVRVVQADVQLAGWWNPLIVCEAPEVDLGTIAAKQVYRCDFVLRNAGTQPLVIDKVQVGCASCLKVIAFPHSLPPGGAGTVSAEFSTHALHGLAIRTLTVHSNAPAHPRFILTIRAEIPQPARETASMAPRPPTSP